MTAVKMAAKSFIFLFLFYLNVSTKCDVVVNGLYRNVVKDNMPSNKDIFECFLNEDIISCVRGKAGKVLDVLEQDVNRQRKVWQKEADAEAAASGRSLKKMPSEVGEEVETTLKAIAQTMMGMARSIFNGGDDVIPASETEEDYSKSTMVDSLSRFSEEIRQLNKKGNGYMMLIGLGSLLVSKMMFFLNLVRLKLQFKFYLIALIALALNIARFLMEWQQKHHLQHGHLSHQKIVYREDEAIAGGYGGEEWKRTKEHEPWDEDDERYPYRGSEKINRIRQPPRY